MPLIFLENDVLLCSLSFQIMSYCWHADYTVRLHYRKVMKITAGTGTRTVIYFVEGRKMKNMLITVPIRRSS